MTLDSSKLENLKVSEQKTIARCPACAEKGGDNKGDHLVIYPDGRYGCVLYPGLTGLEHRKRIFALAGGASPDCGTKVPIKPALRNPIRVVGRVKSNLSKWGKSSASLEVGERDIGGNGTHESASEPSASKRGKPSASAPHQFAYPGQSNR